LKIDTTKIYDLSIDSPESFSSKTTQVRPKTRNKGLQRAKSCSIICLAEKKEKKLLEYFFNGIIALKHPNYAVLSNNLQDEQAA